jgi:DNA-binding CsgD family transcriptional regulator
MPEAALPADDGGHLEPTRSRSIPVLVVDDERRLVEANPDACALLGVRGDALVGRFLDELLTASMGDRLENVWRAFREGGGHAGPFELVTSNANTRRVDIEVTSRVSAGHHLVVLMTSRSVVPKPRRRTSPSGEEPARAPTTRERQILAMLATGATDEQIARLLALSPATVQTHVRNAKAKLGARTRAQAVALALRRGVISLT